MSAQHRGGIEVDLPPEKLAKLLGDAKVIQSGMTPGPVVDEQVNVARVGIKVIPRRRPKEFQTYDPPRLAEICKLPRGWQRDRLHVRRVTSSDLKIK